MRQKVIIMITYLKKILEQHPTPIALDTYFLPQQPTSNTNTRINTNLRQIGKNHEPKFKKIKKCFWSSKEL